LTPELIADSVGAGKEDETMTDDEKVEKFYRDYYRLVGLGMESSEAFDRANKVFEKAVA